MGKTGATIKLLKRKSISRKHILLCGHNVGSEAFFRVECLNLAPYEFESSADVWIECFTGKIRFKRFQIGRVGELDSPAIRQQRHLLDPDDLRGAKFRIKVVSTADSSKGRILGDMSDVPMNVGGTSRGLLPIRSGDIGGLVWSLELDEDSGPVLIINSIFEDSQQVVRDREFRALVMPAIIEKIAGWVIDAILAGRASEIVDKWKRFLEGNRVDFAEISPDGSDGRNDIVPEACYCFALEHGFATTYKLALEQRA